MQKTVFRIIGTAALGLGMIGLILPLVPTTIFLIVAAACFLRSDPERAGLLYGHPRFGPPLRAWRDHRAISRDGKIAATACIITGYGLTLILAGLSGTVLLALGLGLTAVIAFILSRPTASAVAVDDRV